MSNEQRELHERDECPERPVECRLGCGTTGLPLEQGVDLDRSISLHIRNGAGYYIKARDLEHHEKVVVLIISRIIGTGFLCAVC